MRERKKERERERECYMFHGDLNPPDQLQTLPVVEGKAVATGNPQEMTAKNPFGPKLRFERLLLFEILEYLDSRCPLTNGIPENSEKSILSS